MNKCSHSGCPFRSTHRGYCKKHYARFVKWGSSEFKATAANGEHVGCKICGPDAVHKGHGYCDAHLSRLRRSGRLVDEFGFSEIFDGPGRHANDFLARQKAAHRYQARQKAKEAI